MLADPSSTFGEVIARLEANAAGLEHGNPLSKQVGVASKVLVDFAFAMDVLFQVLLADVIERRYIDRRWINKRADFSKVHAEQFGVKPWPCRQDVSE